ncbi:MAG: hypothetical protein WC346_09260 [Methanogenium sp.]|jgi:hypothetical protein
MIRLVFTRVRDTIIVELENKVIVYKDKKVPEGIQFMPKDPKIRLKIIMSRNRIPEWIIELIEEANRGKNLEEYQNANNDEELIPIIIKDFKRNACVFQGRVDVKKEDDLNEKEIKKE